MQLTILAMQILPFIQILLQIDAFEKNFSSKQRFSNHLF